MLAPVIFHKAEKYAIDEKVLSNDNRIFFMKCFGCVRKVHNLYTDFLYTMLEKSGYEGGRPIGRLKLPEVSALKKEYPYLREVDSLALANAKINFERAVKKYNEEFSHKTYTKHAAQGNTSGAEPLTFRSLKGMPKFHSKSKGYFSYKTNCQYPSGSNSLKRPTIRLSGKTLYIPKIKEGIRLIVHRPLPADAVIGNVTISMDKCGKLFASIEYTYTKQVDMALRDAAINNDTSILNDLKFIGLDYSQSDFYVDSEGGRANYPHYYRLSENKLAREQRKLSRMVKGSANYKKQQLVISRLHKKISNQRLDFVRKEAAYLVSKYDVVVVEDIDLRAMGGALSLGKNLHDNGFGMFRRILADKLEQKGSVLVKTDRFFPSTKTCSCCGYINADITLGIREWDCPECGTHHDRDENSASNIKMEGRRILLAFLKNKLESKTIPA